MKVLAASCEELRARTGNPPLGVVVVCNQSLEIYILQDKDMAAMLEENTLQIQSL
jgi:hypothetical protein